MITLAPGKRLPSSSRAQKGAALVVSLIFLLIMTLLGVTALRNTSLEERMAGNMRDHDLAFGAAEAALRTAEQHIEDNVITLAGFDSNGGDGLYTDDFDLNGDGNITGTDENIWQHIDWAGSDSGNDNEAITYSGYPGNTSRSPHFVIQHYGTATSDMNKLNMGNYGANVGAGNIDLFRITVRAYGGSESATVTLQTTYGKRL